MSPSTAWKEQIPKDEDERHERYAEQLRVLQKKHAGTGKTLRALHAKAQAGLEAEFHGLPDLPEHARVGLFATPAKHRAYVRFSNGAGVPQADSRPDVRGVAIKVLGVGGKKIIPGLEDASTQDFLLIRSPATAFRNADEFVSLLLAAEQPAFLLPRMIRDVGLVRTFQILPRLFKGLSEPMGSFATTTYYSAVPVRFGAYAIHYRLKPHLLPDLTSQPNRAPDGLATDLATRLRAGPVSYDFQVQFFVDETKTPIEDASVEWKESDAPFLTLARLVLPQQDLASARGKQVAELVERLSFDPWHAPEEFRPLGNVMRARRHAYRASTMERGAAPEPDGSEPFEAQPL